MKIDNQVILITGASSGIGHATALATRFARRLAPTWLTTKVELGECPKEY